MNIFTKIFETLKKLFRRVFPAGKSEVFDYSTRPWLAHYDKDVPPSIFIPDITLNDVFKRSVEFYAPQKAFCYYGTQFTFKELEELVNGTAAGLRQLGMQKGDRIALLLPNTPQFIIAYWAALKLGLIVALINPLLTPAEIKPLLALVKPRALLVLDLLYRKNRSVIRSSGIQHIVHTSVDAFMPSVTRFVYFLKSGFRDGKEKSSELIAFDRLYIKNAAPVEEKVAPQDGAVLLFTGGVTGTPKAVLLQHRQLVANVMQTRLWMGHIRDGETILGALPFSHSYGMTTSHHLGIYSGSMIVVEPRFKAARIIRLIERYKVTIFPGVPTMFRAITDRLMEKNIKLRPIAVCVSGGAPLDAKLKSEFEEWAGSRLLQGYGLTEASPLTHCMPIAGPDKVGSIGLPCPNTDARIVDLKTAQPVGPDEPGELQIKGPQVMAGYWQNEKETARVIRNGWLCTGDIARMDSDGFFYIVDRKKDLILSGGFNVYPSEVEAVIRQFPGVKDCAVVGIKDDYFGEAVKAFVQPSNGNLIDQTELATYCRERLAVYKRPVEFQVVQDLPRNFIGKIIRRQLS